MKGYNISGTFHDFTKARLFAVSDGNWDYFVDYPWKDNPTKAAIWYVAKEGSGANSGSFGGLDHIRQLIRRGYWSGVKLTDLGRELLGM